MSSSTTMGQAASDRQLRATLEKQGVQTELLLTDLGLARRVPNYRPCYDLVEALLLSRGVRRHRRSSGSDPDEVLIYATVTATYFEPARRLRRSVLRFDALACENRPGRLNVLQRLLERRVMRHLPVLLPMSSRSGLPRERYYGGKRIIAFPPPVDAVDAVRGESPVAPAGAVERQGVLAYAAKPWKKGLDTIISAWAAMSRPPELTLRVAGITAEDAAAYLAVRQVALPSGVEFLGRLSKEQFEAQLRSTSVYLAASRFEDFGMAQLEAMAHGAILVTADSPGPYEAATIVRQLEPSLLAKAESPTDLARALAAGLALDAAEQAEFRRRAAELITPFGVRALDEVAATSLVPALDEVAAGHGGASATGSAGSAESGRPVVAIWRDEWLAPSETFIRDQTAALQRYRPLAVGLNSRVDSIRRPDFAPYDGGRITQWRKWAVSRGVPTRTYQRYLQRHGVTLVHAHFGANACLAARHTRRADVALVATFHGLDVTALPQGESRAARSYRRRLRRLFAQADVLIAVSEFVRDRLLALGAPADKIRVEPIGIPLREATPAEDTAESDHRSGILFVGRFVEKKGISDLLAAVAMLPPEHRDVEVRIAGFGPLETALRDEAARSGLNVRFLGRLDSAAIATELRHSAIFCAPSKTARNGDAEGFGLVFLEAAYQGVPVVSYRSGGVAEAVLDHETGLLADEGDVRGLAAALEELLQDPAKAAELGARGRERVAAEFDIAVRTPLLEQLYDDARTAHANRTGRR